ncbi:CRISPR-associated helicase Cas3' [Acetobacter syzygii]|nr:CRISPR-associated helicase Cas3' [Acetobacter syzygii]
MAANKTTPSAEYAQDRKEYQMLYAHSLPETPDKKGWEPLLEHLECVARRAAGFASPFGCAALAEAAGLLHDLGKASEEYQDYISKQAAKGPDHSTAGAREAAARYGKIWGRLIAFVVAGHHAGLTNAFQSERWSPTPLNERLDPASRIIPDYSRWSSLGLKLPEQADLKPTRIFQPAPDYPGFREFFLTHMLFSALADADCLETERFYAEAAGLPPPARGGQITRKHLECLRAEMAARCNQTTPLNRLRAEILEHAVGKASLAPGLFTLTVPTGGGKTLTSLSFALEHALKHGLRRVIYVIPYTSILEQTAEIFRNVLKSPDDILEHHSGFEWEKRTPDAERDSEHEGREGLDKLRRDAENWDAPIIVTTSVQFFESLFAAKKSRLRKLHNIAQSVVVLDEVQTLPVSLLRPCMAALDELTRNYGTSVVLCTATQPALRKCDVALPALKNGPAQGFDIDQQRELAPDPEGLYATLKRVTVEWLDKPMTDEEIAGRFSDCPQILCIVNTRAHAQALFEAIKNLPGARHLTTLMCPKHRRRVLAEIRQDLQQKKTVRLVSTSLIEAGVDVDFPEVWRAAAGLSSVAQAAGRCNREGRLDGLGRTVVFESLDPRKTADQDERKGSNQQKNLRILRSMLPFWQATRTIRRKGVDPLSLEGVHLYYQELYFNQGYEALDAATLPSGKPGKAGEKYPILPAVQRTASDMNLPFATIASAFRMIDTALAPVIIQWDEDAAQVVKQLQFMPYPTPRILRTLQHYSVPVPPDVRMKLVMAGVCTLLRPEVFGDRFVVLEQNNDLYGAQTGLRLDDPTWRSEESNIF